jgi:hypothetical protein
VELLKAQMVFERRTSLVVGCLLAAAACGKTTEADDDSTGGTGGGGGSSAAAGKGGAAGSAPVGGKGNAGAGNRAGAGGATAGTTASGGASGGSGGSAAAGKGGSGGTPSSGGQGGVAGSGAQADGGMDAGGEAGTSNGSCPTHTAMSHGTRIRSSGFSGTLEQYDTLYDLTCETQADCNTPCLAAGGTMEMCAGNYCMMSTENYCLPATIWTNLAAVAIEGTDPIADTAQLVVWNDPYRDFLLVEDFNLDVPESATIEGITATIRRAGGGEDEAADAGVYLLKGDVMGTLDKSKSTPWSNVLENVAYGGENDLWAETWTPADVNAGTFGVAVSAQYPQSAGNGRAYVDIVYVTVSYTDCD